MSSYVCTCITSSVLRGFATDNATDNVVPQMRTIWVILFMYVYMHNIQCLEMLSNGKRRPSESLRAAPVWQWPHHTNVLSMNIYIYICTYLYIYIYVQSPSSLRVAVRCTCLAVTTSYKCTYYEYIYMYIYVLIYIYIYMYKLRRPSESLCAAPV